MCPNCNAHMKVDSSSKIARCEACGTECLVQDAIKALNVKGNIQVGNATINVTGTNTDSLLQRVELMLADGDFSGAMQKCDTILDTDPKNGKVYFFMLMSDLSCRTRNNLAEQNKIYDGNQYYIKAMKFGDEDLKAELQGYLNSTTERLKSKQILPGGHICFGSHNGESLMWKVLKVNNRQALIISLENIAYMPYHKGGRTTNWKICSLRNWLNNDFINDFFSPKERESIVATNIPNMVNPDFRNPTCGMTTDQAFLLSILEARTMFPNNESRSLGTWWWLRTAGCDSSHAACVSKDGNVFTKGLQVNGADFDGDCSSLGVRPAMWINLDA